MNFRSDTVLSESPNFMNFGLSYVKTTDKIGSVFVPTTRVGRTTNVSNWILPGHDISKATTDRVSKTNTNNHYTFKSELRLGEKFKILCAQNYPMGQSTLDSTPLGTITTNRTTSPIDLIPVEKNARAYTTDSTNGIYRAKRKSARTRGPGSRHIIAILVTKEI